MAHRAGRPDAACFKIPSASQPIRLGALIDDRTADPAIGCLQNFQAQPIFFYNFALFRNSAREFAHQTRYSGRSPAFMTNTEQFLQSIDIHIPRHQIRTFSFANDLRGFVLVTNLTDDFFHQVEAGRWPRRDPRAMTGSILGM